MFLIIISEQPKIIMGRTKKLILFLSIFCMTVVLVRCSLRTSFRSFQKKVIIGNRSDYLIYGLSEKAGDFYYAECDRTSSIKELCKVTVEVPVTDKIVFKKTCKVLLTSIKSYDKFHKFLYPLDHKKVLLVKQHYEGDQSKTSNVLETVIYVIHMAECNVIEISLPSMKSMYVNIRNYVEIFDVLYMTNKKTISYPNCQKYMCRITYSTSGKVIHEPLEYLHKPNFGSDLVFDFWAPLLLRDSVSSISIDYTRTVFNRSIAHRIDQIDRLYRVHNGITTELFRRNSSFLGFSTAQWKVSFCLKDNGNAICRQYDSEGNLLLNFNVTHSDYSGNQSNVLWQPYNLQGGSLIVLIIELSSHDNNQYKVDNLKIVQVRIDGWYTLPLEISYEDMNLICKNQDPSSLVSLKPFITVVEDDANLCLKLICSNNSNESDKYIRYRTDCFPKNYFDKM